jgi:4-hydroxy-tetrahydrodipicolinate reductase
MKIAIVGYGTMGHALLPYAEGKGHTVTAIIDPHSAERRVTHKGLDASALEGCDVAIEFSAAQGIEERIALYAQTRTPAVVATTGWYDRLPELKATYADAPIIWSGNYAIGVQLFYLIVRRAAELFNRFDDYDVLVNEWFHAKKADSPSGTASTLASILIEELDGKTTPQSARLDRRRSAEEIHVSSVRGGYTAGEHTVTFDSPADTITLRHASRSREGYLAGALQAAQWLEEGHTGFCSFEEVLADLFASSQRG